MDQETFKEDESKAMKKNASRKDSWDKFSIISSFISSVLVAGIAGFATYLYNNHASDLNEIEVLDRFKSSLISEDPGEREFAYWAFTYVGKEDLAIKIIGEKQDNAGKNVLIDITKKSTSEKTRLEAQEALRMLKRVWILDDSDPDYREEPFNDTLTLIDNRGEISKIIDGMNICQTIGNHRALTTASDGSYAIIVENVNHQLSRYDDTGEKIWSMKYPNDDGGFTSVAISDTGYAFAATNWTRGGGNLTGRSVLRFDPRTGKILDEKFIGGYDLVVDDKNHSIWLVGGKELKNLDIYLEQKCKISSFGWAGVSIDYDTKGSVWVAERMHPNVPNSVNRLVKVSNNCEILNTIELSHGPMVVRIDRRDNSMWTIMDRKAHQFDNKGNHLLSIENEFAIDTLAIDQQNGAVWAAGQEGLFVYSSKGKLLFRNGKFSNSQKYIAIPNNTY